MNRKTDPFIHRKGTVPLGILVGVLTLLAATAAGLAFLHAFDWLYRYDMNALAIPETTGYSAELILRNYQAVMRYLSPFRAQSFQLPDLSFSPGGAQHFADCKVIFNAVYIIGGLSLIGAVIIGRLNRDRRLMRISGITTLALPALVLALIAIDFQRVFLIFHKTFFSNDLWVFDPRTDPIIEILPMEFFMHCAIVIAAFWVAAALSQLLARRRTVKQPQ